MNEYIAKIYTKIIGNIFSGRFDVHLQVKTAYLKRGTCICAHAWIFLKLCIIMTHYIQTMKIYVLNQIAKNKA